MDEPYDFRLNVPTIKGWGLILVMLTLSSCKHPQLEVASEHHHKLNITPESPHNDPFLITKSLRKNLHTPIWFRLPSSFSAVKKTAILSAMETWEIVTGKDLFVRMSDESQISQWPGSQSPLKPYEELIRLGVSEQDCSVLISAASDGVTDFFFIKEWDALFAHCKDFADIAQAGAFTIPNYSTSHTSQGMVTYISGDIYLNSERFCFRDIKADDCDQHLMEAAIGYMLGSNQSLERIVLHELGHVLGLDHVAPLHDLVSIMQPGAGFYLPGADEIFEMDALLSKGDITRIQSLYGCKEQACDVPKVHVMQQKSQRPNPPLSQF